jgi:hypothetical protein
MGKRLNRLTRFITLILQLFKVPIIVFKKQL